MRPSFEGRGRGPLDEANGVYFKRHESGPFQRPGGEGGAGGQTERQNPERQNPVAWPGLLIPEAAGDAARRRCRPLGLRVLVVESDGEWRRVLERALEENGFDVKAAGSGKEAVRIACGWPPELLVSEIDLPDRDGWELMKVMRSACPRLKGVVLSDRADPEDVEASREAGYSKHLNKQVLPEELIQVLHRVGLS